jgi:16S rRNA (cytosine967-C5)-methyltransferase
MGAYFHSYINTAQTILSSYKFEQPFYVFLKSFFKRNKKYGSRDRKVISNLCYGFFRIGDAASTLDFRDQVIVGYFLTHDYDNGLLSVLKSDWVNKSNASIEDKLELIKISFPDFDENKLFPGIDFLSNGIDEKSIKYHHFNQPDFFIRTRPGKRKLVEKKLIENNISFKSIGDAAIKVVAGVDLNGLIEIDRDAVIQDLSSQATIDYFPSFNESQVSIWDACAGSGGKSIMAADIYRKSRLYVSDIREDILDELARRFNSAGISPISLFCTDLQQSLSKQVVSAHLPDEGVDLIIADVPCTGSGTWGRNPEWLKGFDLTLIDAYQSRQKNILVHLPIHLKMNGYLLYITCSVFRQENEEVTDYFKTLSGLKLIKQGVVHQQGGDYLFAALFRKE